MGIKRLVFCGMLWASTAGAQCAMCYRTAQALNQARGRALNFAILVLGAPPLALNAGFGLLIAKGRAREKEFPESDTRS